MVSSADFSITGSVSGLKTYAQGPGFDGVPGENWTLQLEASPGTDVRSVNYTAPFKDADAPFLAIPGGGVPSTPLGPIVIPAPSSGINAYILRATVNGGMSDVDGTVVPEWTRERMIVTRAPADNLVTHYSGLRKVLAVERLQYSANDAWAGAINAMADLLGGGAWQASKAGIAVTTGSTPLDVHTLAIPTDAAILVQHVIVGNRRSDVQAAFRIGLGGYQRNASAAPTSVVTNNFFDSMPGGWTVVPTIVSNSLVLRITGPAAQTVDWFWAMQWRYLTPP